MNYLFYALLSSIFLIYFGLKIQYSYPKLSDVIGVMGSIGFLLIALSLGIDQLTEHLVH